MKIHGYCLKCHKIRRVRVTGVALATASAQHKVPVGTCDSCEEASTNVPGRR